MLVQDVRYGLRILLKSPGFTVVAAITLALGIGANTAIFSLVDSVLLRELPVRAPKQLVVFADTVGEAVETGSIAGKCEHFSVPLYNYFHEHNQSFENIAAFESSHEQLAVQAPGSKSKGLVKGRLVSGNYFSVLGVTAAAGRLFSEADDRPDASPAIVISYSYWKQHLSLAFSSIGQTLTINGTPYTIIGVTPTGFFGERVEARPPDVWLPMHMQPRVMQVESWLGDSSYSWLGVIGRLKPGVALSQAQAIINVQLRQFLTADAGSHLSPERRKEIDQTYVDLATGAHGLSDFRFRYSNSLRILMILVGLVLLIACANVANLLLTRNAVRRREISIRLAVGASRARIVRQLLTEGILLSGLAAIAGLVLATWAMPTLIMYIAPGEQLPLRTNLDGTVLSYVLATSLLTVLLFGMLPAMQATDLQLVPVLKGEEVTPRKRIRSRQALVVAQVSTSLILLIGCGLFLRSLLNIKNQNMGFLQDHVVLARFDPQLAGYAPPQLPALYGTLLDHVRSFPEIESASLGSASPQGGTRNSQIVSVDGYVPRSGENMEVDVVTVTPLYLETMGMTLISGRDFGLYDGPKAPRVALVNEAFAQHFFHGKSAIARRFVVDTQFAPPGIEIIGVVGNAKFFTLSENVAPMAFLPVYQMQGEDLYLGELEVRTPREFASVAAELRSVVHDVAGNLTVTQVESLNAQVSESLTDYRVVPDLLALFSLLALFLASIGVYGTVAYTVNLRSREFGIRMSLGARPKHVLGIVLRELLLLIGIGLAVGLPISLVASQLVRNQLYGLPIIDSLAVGGAVLILTVVAMIAGYLPARRAMRIDPWVVLRSE